MLWRELRRGLESVIWGGGGGGAFNRSGLAGVNPSKAKGLRTLGTVEALMVLTEWHVRNLHFPVGGEGGWGAFDGVFGTNRRLYISSVISGLRLIVAFLSIDM